MNYFVGAYASSPSATGWDAEQEARYFEKVKQLPNIAGLEHPFLGEGLHPAGDDWFLNQIDPSWDYIFTCIPGTMSALADNPEFGIASDDEAGREQALSFLAKAREAIVKLNQYLGRQAVKAIQIQTAPSQLNASSSVPSLLASLETLVSWDWQGAELVVEHCDAYVEGQECSKGFLTLGQEIQAIRAVNQISTQPVGVCVNWGRSVLETRKAVGAVEHIALAARYGLLKGLMFSGISGAETEYGAWQDTHMPQAPDIGLIGAKESLLTQKEMQACLKAAKTEALSYVGIKLGVRPFEAGIDERIALNESALLMLGKASG